MTRVIINTQSLIFGDAIAEVLHGKQPEFQVEKAERPEDVAELCRWFVPNILLMEVTGHEPWRLGSRLRLRDEVREKEPQCKIVLLVDENVEKEAAREVRQAKKDGLIDQFIYGSISAEYLTAVMDTL